MTDICTGRAAVHIASDLSSLMPTPTGDLLLSCSRCCARSFTILTPAPTLPLKGHHSPPKGFLSNNSLSQQLGCKRCFYNLFRNCHPSHRVSISPFETLDYYCSEILCWISTIYFYVGFPRFLSWSSLNPVSTKHSEFAGGFLRHSARNLPNFTLQFFYGKFLQRGLHVTQGGVQYRGGDKSRCNRPRRLPCVTLSGEGDTSLRNFRRRVGAN